MNISDVLYVGRLAMMYYAMAFWRWVVFRSTSAFSSHRISEGYYVDPPSAGYVGWIIVNGFGVVAFVRLNGRLQFKW